MRVISVCLLGVILALFVVGVVSATPIRHVIQITPLMLAFIVIAKRTVWSHFAALALFSFWIVIMCFIWLWLLGIAHIVSGHFSPTEIAMTVVIGVCCIVGIRAPLLMKVEASVTARVLAFVIFLSLQVFAMWISLLEPVANS